MSGSEILEMDVLEEEQEDTQHGKYITFRMGKEGYGFEISNVNEIIGIQGITELPDVPPFIKGVINLRGKVIPVMDVRIRFGMEEVEYNERTCIIVVIVNNVFIGLIVDEVSEVVDIQDSNIENEKQMSGGLDSRYIKAFGKIDDNVIILLNINSLLFEGEMNDFVENIEQDN